MNDRPMLGPAVVAAIALGLAACTSGASPSPTQPAPSAVGLTVTLGPSGCEITGAAAVGTGPVDIGLENTTDGRFDLDLWRLAEGHEYDELAAHIAEEMRRTQAGEEPLGHPPFADLVAEATAEDANGQLRADLEAGTYGFACVYFATPAAPSGFWAVGPLTAS